jgi:HD-GYP domain-containing protein (c-di-GMP phosphodiesterase class II)
MSATYIPIRVSTLRGDQKIAFSAYVKVAGKYILLCREGDSFEGERLERLRQKKLEKMYIQAGDRFAYDEYMRINLENALNEGNGKPLEVRAQILEGVFQSLGEDLSEDLSNQAAYRATLEGARKLAEFLTKEPQALKAMLSLKNTDFNIFHHGTMVAVIAQYVAAVSGIAESRAMEMPQFMVGCLLHDIEHMHNNIDLKRPFKDMSAFEKDLYLVHAKNGSARVAAGNSFDKIVMQMIAQHDERIDGSGPLKLRERDIDGLVACGIIANEFDRCLLYSAKTPKDMLKEFLISQTGLMPLTHIKALQVSLKQSEMI